MMLTEYYIPQNSLHDFRREMGRFFSEMNGFGNSWPFRSFSDLLPSAGIRENPQAYFIRMNAPGVDPDDVSLSTLGNELTVTMKRPEREEEDDHGRYLRQERVSESSSVSVALPPGIDAEGITAEMKNGVLVIRVPKSMETPAKKIEVRSLN